MYIIINILIFNYWMAFGLIVIYLIHRSTYGQIYDSVMTTLIAAVIWPVVLIYKTVQMIKIRLGITYFYFTKKWRL